MGLVGPGDEVVLIEPAYDSYRPIVEAVGGSGEDRDLVAARVAADGRRRLPRPSRPRPSAVMINSPLNPIGRVFDAEEMAAIARVLREQQCGGDLRRSL